MGVDTMQNPARSVSSILLTLALMAPVACSDDAEPAQGSTTAVDTTSTGSTGSTGTTAAEAECAEVPVTLGAYFFGAIGDETRLLQELVLSDDCTWAFTFTNCDDVTTSEGVFALEGAELLLTATDGTAPFVFVNGEETSSVVVTAGASCDEISAAWEADALPYDESWTRGTACLSGPSCCTDCTTPPPTPELQWCADPPEAC
jgi:hypothetical protein